LQPPLPRLCLGEDVAAQGSDTKSGASLVELIALLFEPTGTGDVEMRPGSPVHKLFEKECRARGSGLASGSSVFQVGNITLEGFLVFVVQRQLPKFLAGFFTNLDQVVDQLLIATHDTGSHPTESRYAGAGQCSDIDDFIWFLPTGIA